MMSGQVDDAEDSPARWEAVLNQTLLASDVVLSILDGLLVVRSCMKHEA
jgi:hypothetical protein